MNIEQAAAKLRAREVSSVELAQESLRSIREHQPRLNAFLTINGYSFQQRFSHRFVDTATILFYLYLTGKIKRKITSSQDAFEYFGIAVQGRHTALGDVLATAQLFTNLVSILYRDSKGKSSAQKGLPDLFASQSDALL